jgi:hypothetical protein
MGQIPNFAHRYRGRTTSALISLTMYSIKLKFSILHFSYSSPSCIPKSTSSRTLTDYHFHASEYIQPPPPQFQPHLHSTELRSFQTLLKPIWRLYNINAAAPDTTHHTTISSMDHLHHHLIEETISSLPQMPLYLYIVVDEVSDITPPRDSIDVIRPQYVEKKEDKMRRRSKHGLRYRVGRLLGLSRS